MSVDPPVVKGGAGAGESLSALVDEPGLGRGAAERTLCEYRPALGADALLDLVRHARPLAHHVGRDLVVAVRSCLAEHVHCGLHSA